jgi:hypothetical protein
MVEAGGIEKGEFRNFQWHIKLRRKSLVSIKFQFLFGLVCLCLLLLVLTSIWHKSGTRVAAPFWL